MFIEFSPRIFVILEIGFFSVISMAVTSVFFFDFARLNSASSSIFWAFSGLSVTILIKPNSPASAIDNAYILIWFLSRCVITSESDPGLLSKKTLTCCIGTWDTNFN